MIFPTQIALGDLDGDDGLLDAFSVCQASAPGLGSPPGLAKRRKQQFTDSGQRLRCSLE